MKKRISFLLAAAPMLSLAVCGGGSGAAGSSGTAAGDAALAEAAENLSDIDMMCPADPMRERDLCRCSRRYSYSAEGELLVETEYFPDELGRIGGSVSHDLFAGTEQVTEYVYKDEGTLLRVGNRTVTEDTADRRTAEFMIGQTGQRYKAITYYDEQGRPIETENFCDGEHISYILYTYDADGRPVREQEYLARDDSPLGCWLYEYD